ncbi:MAG TPA: CoA pyrophosphatase [Chloroflexi bacterium]|nr:CoA pyrophosphatase [Chloroflexota bacterium]
MRKPLPGIRAHVTMAPRPRPRRPSDGTPPRRAGVLLLLYPFRRSLHLALTVRPPHLGHHAGQVSLPGGGWEEGDRSLEQTAIREAREELGVALQDLEILGSLTPLYIPPSHNLVHPFVAHIPRRPQFRPDPREVAELLEVPLWRLMDPVTRREEEWTLGGMRVRVPYYAVGQHKVWGATAIILAEFIALLTQAEGAMR